MSRDLFRAPPAPRLAFIGRDLQFPVHRIYCVGRNFADHAKEMGAPVERGTPTIFMKPADAIHRDAALPYPPGTTDLHHEVEMVVALGRDAGGPLSPGEGLALVCGHGVGLDLTRRDLQAIAKDKRLPWDVAKGFDASAPVSALRHVDDGRPGPGAALWLEVNGERRQASTLGEMIFGVDDILVHLSQLFRLRAGDLVFMGTPAGVAALKPGDRYRAVLEGIAELDGRVEG
ncbi:MAG: fumarylacetoacetate hydrolase family protein [Lysobacteraceae bacterium]|jgi:fumarylpyruvate hydrolase|nr:fumarylacetoacetate hydrolase family protein [Xanthomonadaceae bacterium]MCZ8319057.1 fumarylacetoacetate hydrolase family protein [Silanimonas sp.]